VAVLALWLILGLLLLWIAVRRMREHPVRRALTAGTGVVLVASAAALFVFDLRVQRGVARAEALFESQRPAKLGDIGTTKTLSILPLIDWHSSEPNLKTEMGVSYLIETDAHRILFDVGHNAEQSVPSPLQANMAALGLDTDDFDTIFISHNHFDHVGGTRANDEATFMLGLDHEPLPGKRAFVPVPLSYPGIEPVVSAEPTIVGPGLASTGTIPRQLAFGWIDEQALAIHVEGRGVVLVVGCGHQTMPKLLERYDDLFDIPLYGVIGGLHYPVPDGRFYALGINLQRRFASGRGIFDPIDMPEVRDELRMLEARNLGLIGVGGHDSSDEVIAMFRERFGPAYRDVRVGQPITLSNAE
jgi:metal-dependent hydrolase (beta-lactamase superfamily II)